MRTRRYRKRGGNPVVEQVSNAASGVSKALNDGLTNVGSETSKSLSVATTAVTDEAKRLKDEAAKGIDNARNGFSDFVRPGGPEATFDTLKNGLTVKVNDLMKPADPNAPKNILEKAKDSITGLFSSKGGKRRSLNRRIKKRVKRTRR